MSILLATYLEAILVAISALTLYDFKFVAIPIRNVGIYQEVSEYGFVYGSKW